MLGRRCVELVGHGDVMRPWQWDDAGSHVRAEIGWTSLEPTRLAVLDHALVLRIAPGPQLGLELFNRGTRRAHHLAVALAIAHHQRVDDRLLLTLWHLPSGGAASTPTASGPLPLGHQRLADLVGAQRQARDDRDGRPTTARRQPARQATGSCTATPPAESEPPPAVELAVPTRTVAAAIRLRRGRYRYRPPGAAERTAVARLRCMSARAEHRRSMLRGM